MNVIYIKIKGKEEIAFPGCCYEHCDNFLVVRTLENFLEVGAFNKNIVEYVYLHYTDGKRDAREWFEKGVKLSK